ncbi:MAG TPA: GGDEF domain-containing protein [Xanthomonadaceae bacterium]|nr:GGDEF domain-containing protein [Xanthomonadaceae bacterium]
MKSWSRREDPHLPIMPDTEHPESYDVSARHRGRGPGAVLHALLVRLRSDLRLAVLCLFGLCAVVLITPFAIYRLLTGSVLMGVVDFAIVVVFAGLVVFGWRTGRSALAGNLAGGAAALAVLVVVPGLGIDHDWAYATTAALFLLAERRWAAIDAAVMVVPIGSQGWLFESGVHQATYLTVATMIATFCWVFASRAQTQRDQLHELATLDPLTGARNRRALVLDLGMTVGQYHLAPEPVALVMIDIDHFKRLNDLYGHATGDRVLSQLAELVRRHTRRGDHFYRYGGDEFVLLLPSTNRSGLAQVLGNLRAAFAWQLGGPEGPVTVSLGAALLEPDETPHQWLTRADDALYAAKRAGRDRLRISADPAIA